ncbi:hypothetical protein RO575_11275 [Methylomonas sp. MO1]|uniref:hypothetical protein n=1 Tax=Methylomonas sp. MO1 TaxID=3073619 RepID=UPI0028A3D2E5|nr:hypothetical protein [Methylomonas sp. MO1]MDT4290140.1 hypothetical protein [Methylomonas sp. MO1]
MNKTALLTTVFTSLAAFIEPAAAKSVTLLPVVCSQGTPTAAVFQKQGALFSNLGFNGGSVGVPGIWHTTITDNQTTLLLDFTDTNERPAPSIFLASVTLPKGTHLLTYHSENLNTGETCDFLINSKV